MPKKKLEDYLQSTAFVCSKADYTEVLTRLREYMLIDGRPKSTIIAYCRSVRDLMECQGKVPLELSDEDVISHLSKYRDEHDLGSSTVNSRICGLRYLYHRVYKETGRRLVIPNPRRRKQIGEVLTEHEVELLLAACHYPQQKAILHLFHPHTLRHTFAVHYLNNGGSIIRLQQLLGHSDLGSTLLYLKYAAIPLRDIATPLDVLRGTKRERK